ncbi:MAG: hypothetical protein HPY53_14945 [Brevinematales bacterium]|nr:hypothetical protein [Brevinematales bacterium]
MKIFAKVLTLVLVFSIWGFPAGKPVKQGMFDNIHEDDNKPVVKPDNVNKAGLNAQIEVTEIDISPLKFPPGSMAYAMISDDGVPDAVLQFAPDGTAYIGFSDSEHNSYIYKLDSEMQPGDKPLIMIKHKRLENFVITENGFGIAAADFFYDPEAQYDYFNYLYFYQYSMAGKKLHENFIVGCGIWENEGDQSYGGDGTDIAWSGELYALYFTTFRKWDDGVVHESEYLTYINPDGEQLRDEDGIMNGWTWNTSHSFRPHIEYYAKDSKWMLATMGDAYPMGLVTEIIHKDPTDYSKKILSQVIYKVDIELGDNDTHVSIGDTMIVDKGMLIVADNKENLPGYDLCMFYQYPDGTYKGPIMLTKTPMNFERMPKVAKYGDNYLIAWAEEVEEGNVYYDQGEFMGFPDAVCYAMVVSPDGKVIIPAQKLDVHFRGNTEFFNYDNGDIGWIDSTQSDHTLNIIRLKVNG